MKINNTNKAILVIIMMFTLIILFEVIIVNYKTSNRRVIEDNLLTGTQIQEYDTSSLEFEYISLSNIESHLYSICKDGCNLKIFMYNTSYDYIIRRSITNKEYYLYIFKDSKLLLDSKRLGNNIENLRIVNYTDYIVLKNIVSVDVFNYDYALLLDNRGEFDEFSSMDSNEMEFTENGIIYYYDECSNTSAMGLKIKVIRLPFSNNPIVISNEAKPMSWCK